MTGKKRKYSNFNYQHLDSLLLEYKNIDREIAIRKLEIETSHETDVNVGGSRGNGISNPVETIIIKWDSDLRLKSLEHTKEIVEKLKTLLDSELSHIFDLRYGKYSSNSWEEIADKIHTSSRNVYRKRDRILEIFGELSGM